METVVTSVTAIQQEQLPQHEQQQQQQPMAEQQLHKAPQPAVEKLRRLLYRRLKVVLPSGRVIEGDLACLDKQGNLILSNACEHISSSGAASTQDHQHHSSSSSTNSRSSPQVTQLGMVLVPRSQQHQVSLRVSLAEKAAMLSLTAP